MFTSEQVDEIAGALVAFHAAVGPIVKANTADTGSYRYTYADLATIEQATRPVLASCGLMAMQSVGEGDRVTTRIWHSSGQWIETDPYAIPGVTGNAQAHGSAVTYARRYSLLAALGLATEDDDGSAAVAAQAEQAAIDEAKAARITDVVGRMKSLPDDNKSDLKAWADGKSLAATALAADPAWLDEVETWLDKVSP